MIAAAVFPQLMTVVVWEYCAAILKYFTVLAHTLCNYAWYPFNAVIIPLSLLFVCSASL